MIKLKLTALQLGALTHRIGDECALYKPDTANGKMIHALLLEVYKKLHNSSAFPLKVNKFTLSAPRALALYIYFRNNQSVGELSDNLIKQIVADVDQKQ